MTGEWCEHAGLGQTASFKVLLVPVASTCVYLLLSSNLWGEFIGLMLLSQSSFYLTSSKVRICQNAFFLFVCKLTKEEKKRYSNYSMHVNITFPQATSVVNTAVYQDACISQSKISVICRSYIAHAAWLSFLTPPPSNTPTTLCGTTSECGKAGCLWILNYIFPMRLQKYCKPLPTVVVWCTCRTVNTQEELALVTAFSPQ